MKRRVSDADPAAQLIVTLFTLALAAPVPAALLTFNSSGPVDNATARQSWLTAAGITTPQYLVDFEVGFANNQNIHALGGLFPAGLLFRDSSSAHAAIIRSGAGVINGSNPVGVYALTQNEQPYLELDFTEWPIDYLGLQDIDHTGTSTVVTFLDDTTATFSFETTGGSGDTAEFVGIFRNDRPRIRLVRFDSSGDGRWGIDTIEYGRVPVGCAGDLNCDGVVDFFDIDPLVLAFQGETAYLAVYPQCVWLNGDADGDSDVDFFDIDPFVGLLGTTCP